MPRQRFASPLALPIHFFAVAILCGAALLRLPASLEVESLSFIDALFTATSAACVTGLSVVDTGTTFSRFGQSVILALIQAGGLGIMTLSSLFFYLLRRRVTMTDHIAVGQTLLHDPSFRLGWFLLRMALVTIGIELAGAASLYLCDPAGFTPYSALFHSVSAFCNAGFSLFPDNLMGYVGHAGVNLTIMALITLGGLGFSVLLECYLLLRPGYRAEPPGRRARLSWYSRTVLTTSLFLVLSGAAFLYLGEHLVSRTGAPTGQRLLAAFFQSVTCRTAGFNTVDVGAMTNLSLMCMILLMFIGGSPGSCAGGIKTTTFRVLAAFGLAQFRGRDQAVIGRYAVDQRTLSNAVVLFILAATLVMAATFLMHFSEGEYMPHSDPGDLSLDILFEVVSAFGTVGLSTGLTPKLTTFGKSVITSLMFIGRLGPILFLAVISNLQHKPRYAWPEEGMLIG